MHNEPIRRFRDLDHAKQLLAEWQERLFLQHWIIKLDLENEPVVHDGNRLLGLWSGAISQHECDIKLFNGDDEFVDESCIKWSAEHVLVHELLHCKYNFLNLDLNFSSNKYFDLHEHALIEQMAKSLIMAKYDIKFDWFKNF